MFSLRRLLVFVIVFISPIALKHAVSAQQKELPQYSSMRLFEDARFRQVINVARDCIAEKEWKQTVEALDAVLKEKDNPYIWLVEGNEYYRWTSAKYEANRMLGSMPPEGLQVYEETVGAQAKSMFDEALKKNNQELLATVAVRFRHTKAGKQAQMLTKKFLETAQNEPSEVKEWRSWRGNTSNTAQAIGGPPRLDAKLWSRPLFVDGLEGTKMRDPDEGAFARVNGALKQTTELKRAVLPGAFPIAVKDIAIYRRARDVAAVSLRKFEIKTDDNAVFVIKPGEVLWRSIPYNRGLAVLMQKPQYREALAKWLEPFEKIPGFTSFVFENTLLGSLSADDRNVYAINDMAVPPHPGAFERGPNNPFALPPLRPFLMQNELFAYDIHNGKLKWDLGAEDELFKDSHFLSVPVSVGGKLYVLNECQILPAKLDPANPLRGESELRLFCLDPHKIVMVKNNPKPAIDGPPIVLGKVSDGDRFVYDIRRRIHAAPLAYADGVLVCPTNAGEIFGVDLRTRTPMWSYSYRESAYLPVVLPGQALPKGKGTTVLAKWKASPPAIQAGKIVFTAPDADSIHCVNLSDGKRAWRKAQKQGDLYMAGVFEGRILIVGDAKVRALDLKDGRELWAIANGDLPSGQGIAIKGVYYLPLKKNEIVAIDLANGVIKSRLRGNAKDGAPGNLVLYRDTLISQTPTDIIAYPTLKALLEK